MQGIYKDNKRKYQYMERVSYTQIKSVYEEYIQKFKRENGVRLGLNRHISIAIKNMPILSR
ncbi:MAG: hypothetical protein ACR5KV_01810 [Wolbachia sp.]